jgi:predicted transcriptional regulator
MTAVLTKPISVRFTDDMSKRVATLAKVARRSPSEIVRETMELNMDRLEWEYRIAEIARGVRVGTIPTHPMENLLDEMGITQEELDAAPLDLDSDGLA